MVSIEKYVWTPLTLSEVEGSEREESGTPTNVGITNARGESYTATRTTSRRPKVRMISCVPVALGLG